MSAARRGLLNRRAADMLHLEFTLPAAPRHVSQATTVCPHRARSPVNAELLVAGIQSHPVPAFVAFTTDILLNGAGAYFTTPFDDSIPRDHCDNQKSATDHPDAVDAWVLNEMSKGRVAGPFPTLAAAHPELQVSPFGSVPKGKTGKRRATHNLSKDFADVVSVNGHVDRGDATLSYVTVVAVIASANKFRRLPGGSPAVGCTDIVDAFRNVRQAPDCAHLCGFKWGLDGGPIGYFVDLCLGFGGRMNPFLWDCVAAALQWVMTARFAAAGLIADIYRLLDDVLTIGRDDYHSAAAHKCVLDTLADHGLPSHPGKEQFGRQVIFLGLGLNLTEFFLELPEDKRVEMIAMLDSIASSSHQLRTATCESITGKLGFAQAAMPHNRARINSFYASMGPALRGGAHWMNPSAQMKRDAASFSRALSRQPQVAFSVFEADPTNSELTCAVDAAGRDGAGGHGLDHASGRTFGFHTPWTPGWTQDDPGVSSGLQELFTIGLVILMHAADFSSITVWTDSTVATDVVAKGRSSIGPLNHIVQIILDVCAEEGCTLVVAWHGRDSSPSAIAADLLSRNDFQAARRLVRIDTKSSQRDLLAARTRLSQRLPASF